MAARVAGVRVTDVWKLLARTASGRASSAWCRLERSGPRCQQIAVMCWCAARRSLTVGPALDDAHDARPANVVSETVSFVGRDQLVVGPGRRAGT